MAVSWLYLAVSVLGAWFTFNAYRPIFAPAPLAVVSFFAGWLTAELAVHHLLWQIAITAGFVWQGALKDWPGWVGLALTLLSWSGLVFLCRQALDARNAIDGALSAALGDDYHAWSEGHTPLEINHRQLALPLLPIRHREVERIRNIAYHQQGKLRLKLDVHRHKSAKPGCPALIYVHGGAWVLGDKDTQGQPLMQHLAAQGWVCFGIEYRLSPRATFPDHLIDVKRAIAWVREHAAEYGADPNFILIAGGSAGGHLASLAALTANDPIYQPGFEHVDTRLDGCVGLYGVYDFEDEDKVWPHQGLIRLVERHVLKASRQKAPEAWKLASPVRRVSPEAPPFLVIHGDLDTLVPVESARRFVAKFRSEAGAPIAYAEIPGAQHAFEVFPSLRTALVLQGVARFGAWLFDRKREGHVPKVVPIEHGHQGEAPATAVVAVTAPRNVTT